MKMRSSRREFLQRAGATVGAVAACPGGILRAAGAVPGVGPDDGEVPPSHRADWMYRAKWGVFMHYLAARYDLPVAEWNRLIDGFNLESLASQIGSTGAGYFFITLGQNSGHYLSPNPVYDSLAGTRKCSRRDLVADLYAELAKRSISLMVYLPAGAPDRDPAAMKRLEWKKGPYRNAPFQRKWQQVIAEWSRRWGPKVRGWWFDGCYWPNAMYRTCTPPNFRTFAEAARQGNPASAVAFNPGVFYPIFAEAPEEDYTAGEINDVERVHCHGRWVDGAQFHMLSFLGSSWSRGEPRLPATRMAEITARIVQPGGVVTWDVPHGPTARISPSFMRQLDAIGNAVAAIRR